MNCNTQNSNELQKTYCEEDKLGSRYANTDDGSNRKQVLEIGWESDGCIIIMCSSNQLCSSLARGKAENFVWIKNA